MAQIAVLGIGHMGAPIAHRLLDAGHLITVWNRTAARSAGLAGAGARVVATPADAVHDAEIVITMVTDGEAVSAILFGPHGAAAAMRPGTCLVEMSTVGPTALAELARQLPAGIDLVDAPVGGSVGAARSGRLTVFAGGDGEVITRITPILEVLGTVRRCGPSGSGAALKLVLNTALVAGLAALSDVLAVADAVGVDRDAALAALAGGVLGGAAERATAAAGNGASFAIALAGKDLRLALGELGRAAPAPIARAAMDRLQTVPDQTADLGTIVGKEAQ